MASRTNRSLSPLLEAGRGSKRTLEPHRNAGLEIVYLERGHLHWQVDGHVELVPPRSVFFTLPWQRHGSVMEFEPGHLWHFAVLRVTKHGDIYAPGPFEFAAKMALSRPATRRIASLLRNVSRHVHPASPLMCQLLPELVREHQNLSNCRCPERLAALAKMAVLELAEGIEQLNSADRGDLSSSDRRVEILVSELARRCDDAWTLSDMAATVGLGRTRLAELLREKTGDSPRELLNRLRIARARHQLLGTDQSITTIAMNCGFTTSQYFAEVFHRFTGLSPRQFRAMRRATK